MVEPSYQELGADQYVSACASFDMDTQDSF